LGKIEQVVAEIFKFKNRRGGWMGGWLGGWVGSGERIMPLCGPSCKLRLSRSSARLRFQDRPSMAKRDPLLPTPNPKKIRKHYNSNIDISNIYNIN
jgi:hypothetical protein